MINVMTLTLFVVLCVVISRGDVSLGSSFDSRSFVSPSGFRSFGSHSELRSSRPLPLPGPLGCSTSGKGSIVKCSIAVAKRGNGAPHECRTHQGGADMGFACDLNVDKLDADAYGFRRFDVTNDASKNITR
jgi:hypothetical protein